MTETHYMRAELFLTWAAQILWNGDSRYMGLIPVSSTNIGCTYYVYGVTTWQKIQRPSESTAHYLTKKNSSSEKKMQIVKVIDATQENAATSFPMILGTDWWESVAKIGAIPIKITQLILFLNLYN